MNHFSNIIGQAGAVDFLQKAITHDTVSHAYLFVGPSGVGKMLTAVTFAWQLIAQTDEEAPIFQTEGAHPDILVLEVPADKTVIIKEQITEEMEPWLALKPYRAKRRIVIIRDSHLMRREVANALLKTLEEPPWYAVIILVADQEITLDTITSRCQTLRFFPVNDMVMEEYLIANQASAELAAQVTKLAQGNVALARRFINEEKLRDKWEQAREMMGKLNSSDTGEVFRVAELIETDVNLYINMLETIIRDIIIYKKTQAKDLLINIDNISLADNIADDQAAALKDALQEMQTLKGNYQRNVNAKLINVNIARSLWQALHQN